MELLSLGKEPINPDQPTGSDIRYEPEFEELQSEIDKLSSPSAASGIDWKKVNTIASSILAEKSKDILVTSYLAVAQIYIGEMEGLAVGLCVFRDLLEQFWENLFPPKKRIGGRLAAVEWWLEKTESACQHLKPAPMSPETLDQLKENLEQIDKRLEAYFDTPPSVRALQRFLDAIPSVSEEKPAEAVPPAQGQTQTDAAPDRVPEKTPPSTPAAEVEDIGSEKDAQNVLRSGLQKIRQVAAYLHETNPKNPQSYKYTRFAAWSSVEELPPSANGRTRIPPPAAQVVKILQELLEKADRESLLKSAERRLSQFIFWLDLNRFVADALEGLGQDYQQAHDTVCRETALFIDRLPGLNDLTFSDGMPFADAKTKEWLKGIALGKSAAIDEPVFKVVTGSTDGDEDQMAEAIQKAQRLAKKKQFVEAVEGLQTEMRKSGSRKKTLQWRLALSQILMSSKQANLAGPLFDQILQDIETYRLEEWDPDSALDVLKSVWMGFNNLTDKAYKDKAVDILNRIARLDPAQALQLGA
jgi:type VI secretion system protein VasJ